MRTWLWLVALAALLTTRLPALVEPVGNDQQIYLYVADRMLAGEVPYVDAWDQKPPGVFFIYAALRRLWPHPQVVAIADLAAAVVMTFALVGLGRRTGRPQVGYIAAALALLFGHPGLTRIGGVYVRGQCETFIAPAVAVAVLMLARDRRHRRHLLAAGAALGAAFWLKYNALAYALPAMVAVVAWRPSAPSTTHNATRELAWVALGFGVVAAAVLSYFAWHRALGELWVSTVLYNLGYSGETYAGGLSGALGYLWAMLIDRVRADLLWFLGTLGLVALLVIDRIRHRQIAALAATWLAATIGSILINGARDLPQYFVQAVPAFSFAAACGLATAWQKGRPWQIAIAGLVVLGLWKVGVEQPSLAGWRWGGIPQIASNVQLDLDFVRGRLSRDTFLARFKGAQKYDALAIERLTEHVRLTTRAEDRILVFGFAPGVYVESGRRGASRFFWSRPVVVEFAAERPKYGSRGLLFDLIAHPPALVALQKKDWEPGDANSREFFENTPALRDWLTEGFVLDDDTPIFTVWKRRS